MVDAGDMAAEKATFAITKSNRAELVRVGVIVLMQP
jgi:hypothetical protein